MHLFCVENLSAPSQLQLRGKPVNPIAATIITLCILGNKGTIIFFIENGFCKIFL